MGNEIPKSISKKPSKETHSKKKRKLSDVVSKGRHDPSKPIGQYYEITSTLLGTGNFSQVKLGISKLSSQKVAIKIIDKKRVKHRPEILTNEVEILTSIDNKYIIKLLDLFDTPDYLYLVMELVRGGELFDRIVERESYSEADAKEVMRQLLLALEYIHSRGIVHRDLKPENLLLESANIDTNIKLSDFGLSKIYDNEFLRTACGTPGYIAPEILNSMGYGPPVDLWSAGVICYILLCGYPPFYNDNDAVLFESILTAKYSFHSPYWDQISKPAKDLIRSLLVLDPSVRLTATEALKMEWFSNSNTSHKPLSTELREELTLYRTNSKIKSKTASEALLKTLGN